MVALTGAAARPLTSTSTPLRHYLMCAPEHFDVVYSINPWMRPEVPVDAARALAQWSALVSTFGSLGHRVDFVAPRAGLPDMVFAANSALVIGGRTLTANFLYSERRGEEAPYRAWFEGAGHAVARARHHNEGEGDFVVVGDVILAASGFRTTRAAHREVERYFGMPVVSLELCDPRFYHLDTALFALGPDRIAYYPLAFSEGSRAELAERYPDAILADAHDASVLGLNAVCDGRHVVMAHEAEHLAAEIAGAGYDVVGVDLSELRKAGGGVKCCTLEVRSVTEDAR
jgi:N-dimethylarginine dimethylaminohydrolase